MHHFKEWGFGKKIVLVFLGLILFAGLTFVFGLLVMLLWNWLMPDIFSLPVITYWQAWGLVVLAHILFKGGHTHHKPWHNHMRSKWKQKFRQHFHNRIIRPSHGSQFGGDDEDVVDDSTDNEDNR